MDRNRRYERFSDFGRVECKELCPFPGTLKDISQNGLKVSFNSAVDLDMNDQYRLIVRVPNLNSEVMEFLASPAWAEEVNGTFQIGFSILFSTGFTNFSNYIHNLREREEFEREETEFERSDENVFV